MKIRILVCFFATMLSAVQTTNARLGETIEELKQRFGEPTDVGESREGDYKFYVFEKDGVKILAGYSKQKDGSFPATPSRITYRKKPLTEEEVWKLLELNKQGLGWRRANSTNSSGYQWTVFMRSDGAKATWGRVVDYEFVRQNSWDGGKESLEIYTKEEVDVRAKEKEAKEQRERENTLKGF